MSPSGTWDVRSVQPFPSPTATRTDTTSIIVLTGTVTLGRYGEIMQGGSVSARPFAGVETTTALNAVEYRAALGEPRCSGAPLACWEGLGGGPVATEARSAIAGYDANPTVPRYVSLTVSLRSSAGGLYSAYLRWDPYRAAVYDSSAAGVLELRRRE